MWKRLAVITKPSSCWNSTFSHGKTGTFFQDGPQLANCYLEDAYLQRYMKRLLPAEVFDTVHADLVKFGGRTATDLNDLARQCELNPPYLEQHDAWGKRVDKVVTCDAWKQMKRESAIEGIVSLAYRGSLGQWSRLHQLVKVYLFHPSSGLFSCPIAMTDGAAKIIHEMKQPDFQDAFQRLTSRDPEEFWTSGQWMTERKGGSDVANGTETLAIPQSDGTFRLHGYKWFSSATDSDMAFTLGRIAGNDGNFVSGTKGLSMFFLETRQKDGNLNGIQVIRLKNKLGTRQLPTGELLLDRTVAKLASPAGKGVASISHMLTITRIHNSAASLSAMRRIITLARDYSLRRKAFGNSLENYPLHLLTLSRMETEIRGGMALFIEVGRLLGLEDQKLGSEQDSLLLRVLTPILKLYTAKQCVPVVSEGLECFGGQGYMEDTGLPVILRDVQVTPIWEGTTNVLSLDVLRAIERSGGGCIDALQRRLEECFQSISSRPSLAPVVEKLRTSWAETIHFMEQNGKSDIFNVCQRDLAFTLGNIAIGALMLEHACWQGAATSDISAVMRWCDCDLAPVVTNHKTGLYYTKDVMDLTKEMVYDGYNYTQSSLS